MNRTEPNEFHRQVGERLRRVREEQRLTLHAVEILSCGRFKRDAIVGYEHGRRAITVETAAELASVYGVPLAEILGRQLTLVRRVTRRELHCAPARVARAGTTTGKAADG